MKEINKRIGKWLLFTIIKTFNLNGLYYLKPNYRIYIENKANLSFEGFKEIRNNQYHNKFLSDEIFRLDKNCICIHNHGVNTKCVCKINQN